MRLLLTVVCVLLVPSLAFSAEHTKDTPQVVNARVKAGKALLLDVREKSEWDAGHLKVAKLAPLSKLRRGIEPEEIVPQLDKKKIVYTHCRVGGRCLIAADILKKQGYDVRALKQGYRDLLKAGFEDAE